MSKDIIEMEPGVVADLPLKHVEPDPNQPRTYFVEDYIEQLAASIKASGVNVPIEVRPHPETEGKYIIVDGGCRYLASKKARKKTIPALLSNRAADDPLELAFAQVRINDQREELNVMDRARFLRRLHEEFNINMSDIPAELEKHGLETISREYVSNLIRLTRLPEEAQDMIANGQITPSHGKHLLKAVDSEQVMEQCIEEIRTRLADGGAITEQAVESIVCDCYRELYPALEDINYSDDDIEDVDESELDMMPPLFDPEKLDKKDYQDLQVRKVKDPWTKETSSVALNKDKYRELQQAALEERRQQQSSPSSSSDSSESGTQFRGNDAVHDRSAGPPEHKLRDYLFGNITDNGFGWLRQQIVHRLQAMPLEAAAQGDDIRFQITRWLAFQAPYSMSWHDHLMTDDCNCGTQPRDVAQENGLSDIDDFLKAPDDFDKDCHALAYHAVMGMGRRSLCRLAQHMNIDLDTAGYRIDETYLAMHTGAALEALWEAAGCSNPEEYKKLKVGDKRVWMLEEAAREKIGIPANLLAAWQTEFGYAFGVDDDDDDIETVEVDEEDEELEEPVE